MLSRAGQESGAGAFPVPLQCFSVPCFAFFSKVIDRSSAVDEKMKHTEPGGEMVPAPNSVQQTGTISQKFHPGTVNEPVPIGTGLLFRLQIAALTSVFAVIAPVE